MGGWLFCGKCDGRFHSHDGGIYIEVSDINVCEYCASELEAQAELIVENNE